MSLIYIALEWFPIGECSVIGLWHPRGTRPNDKKSADGPNLRNIPRTLSVGSRSLVHFLLAAFSCSDNLHFSPEPAPTFYLDCRRKITILFKNELFLSFIYILPDIKVPSFSFFNFIIDLIWCFLFLKKLSQCYCFLNLIFFSWSFCDVLEILIFKKC